MLRFFSSVAMISILAVGTQAHAQNPTPHQQRLSELQARLEVETSSFLPFAKNVQGVESLHRLVFDPQFTNYFGHNALVQRVLIREAMAHENTPINADRVSLRDHAILFNFDGSDIENLKSALPRFETELAQIQATEASLIKQWPRIVFTRKADLVTNMTNTNKSYQQNLNSLSRALASNAQNLSNVLNSVYQVNIVDTSDFEGSTSLSRGLVQIYDHDTGHLVTKHTFQLVMGRERTSGERNFISEELLSKFFDIVVIQGFRSLDFTANDEKDIPQIANDFYAFLTQERAAALRHFGVESFSFKSSFRSETDLLKNHELTLGLTAAEMQEAYDLAFRL